MVLPARITVHDCGYALDGGTTVLHATDETGCQRDIMLVQHAFPQGSPSLGAIPGRLYFDGELVSMWSPLEAALLDLLRTADVADVGPIPVQGDHIQLSSDALILGEDIRQVLNSSPEENMRRLVADIVLFVQSAEYLAFAERVEQAADPARYTVWIKWEPAGRNQVVIRLARVLGIGLQSARELLDRETPVAEGVSALEVSQLAGRYAAEGLAVRTEPAFRWRCL